MGLNDNLDTKHGNEAEARALAKEQERLASAQQAADEAAARITEAHRQAEEARRLEEARAAAKPNMAATVQPKAEERTQRREPKQ